MDYIITKDYNLRGFKHIEEFLTTTYENRSFQRKMNELVDEGRIKLIHLAYIIRAYVLCSMASIPERNQRVMKKYEWDMFSDKLLQEYEHKASPRKKGKVARRLINRGIVILDKLQRGEY